MVHFFLYMKKLCLLFQALVFVCFFYFAYIGTRYLK